MGNDRAPEGCAGDGWSGRHDMGDRGGKPVVAVVDDDPLFLETLVDDLCDHGFAAIGLNGPAAARDHFAAGKAATVVVLDWQMPGQNGPDLLAALRAQGHDLPALFLTGLSQPIYEEAALRLGAVDFIDKSRSFEVIRRRLTLVLGGVKGDLPEATPGDPLGLDEEGARATWRGAPVPLTLTEFKAVACLARAAGPVSHRAIYDAVRGEGFAVGSGDEGLKAAVGNLIRRIRKKFAAVDAEFTALDTAPGTGYRWQHPEPPAA